MILTFIRDLMFGSKVDGLLSALGHQNKKIRSADEVAAALNEAVIDAAVVNLGIPGDEPFTAVRALLAKGIPVYCYYPHVETELFARATELGANEVHPRGAILAVLQDALPKGS
jgi:DNA-binding NarL/FixJ family response regulator